MARKPIADVGAVSAAKPVSAAVKKATRGTALGADAAPLKPAAPLAPTAPIKPVVPKKTTVLTDTVVPRTPNIPGPITPGPITPGPIGPAGPVIDVDIGVQIPPTVYIPKVNVNLFDKTRPGQPVVRADDLLAMRVETVNMKVSSAADSKPQLTRSSPSGEAFLILHLPPQAIAEEVFYERADEVPDEKDAHQSPNATVNPKGTSETGIEPPVLARIAEESRLVFTVPANFTADYTLQGVLAACETLAMSVAANALAKAPLLLPPIVIPDLVLVDRTLRLNTKAKPAIKVKTPVGKAAAAPSKAAVAKAAAAATAARAAAAATSALDAVERSSRAVATLRQLQIALREGADSPTLALRAAAGSAATMDLKFNVPGRVVERPDFEIGSIEIPRIKPRPVAPGAHTTSIELPWRLIISPHAAERWSHATGPVTSPVTARTELWHSRLVTRNSQGVPVDYPNKDAARTVRAIWARGGENPAVPMQSAFPTDVLTQLPPSPGLSPFRQTLDDSDRYQIVHLSSNFAFPNYVPQPVQVNALMLSALGGWLDSRGNWEPPGLSVEEWTHRAAMARDHYVRVVYKGYLFPFGHRVSLVKVTERKFHNGKGGKPALAGNAAVLRQRMFIVVRERERIYADAALRCTDDRSMSLQFPFSRVAITTVTTPNIDPVGDAVSAIGAHGQRMFWPCVGGAPFRFHCVATDLDGRNIDFELPMIFMDNTYASPRTNANLPNYVSAKGFAKQAQTEWRTRDSRRIVDLRGQRVALAASLKAGDTACEAVTLEFGAEAESKTGAASLETYSNGLNKPLFYPSVVTVSGRVPALAQLGGTSALNTLNWNLRYLKNGFTGNRGEVYADVASSSTMGVLDFSGQGDRSGGFAMPNIKPSALSRLNGPVSGDAAAVNKYMDGAFEPESFFPTSLSSLPLPLLFGCIPLGAVIGKVADLAGAPDQVPKFVSEAANKAEALVNDLVRLIDFVRNLGSNAGSIADAAVTAAKALLDDLLQQALTLAAAQVQPLVNAINQVKSVLDTVRTKLADLGDAGSSIADVPDLGSLIAQVNAALGKANDALTAANAAVVPAGFKQSALSAIKQLQTLLNAVLTVPTLIAQGKALFNALDAVVGDPSMLANLVTNPSALADALGDVRDALSPIRGTLATSTLLDGAPKQTLISAIDAAVSVLGTVEDLLPLLESLFGEELVMRLDWQPKLENWALNSAQKETAPLFRANDKRGFLLAVEARMKKNGQGGPKIGVVCSLKHFDLILINPAGFLELNFEKIEFRVDSGAKMNVDVLLKDIKFIGPLSFVETLRDIIPLDGFSDPPSLDITAKGIDASFSVAIPNIAVGMFSLTNLSLGAGFTVPFIGEPLSVRFFFCTREQPFNLTVSLFGGGGFFGITIDPSGVQIMEASFEFGASISVDFGVASGGVHVMAGVYFRMEQDDCLLVGYFRLGGYVSVLGLISASLELYLELRYQPPTGKVAGKAELTIEVSVFMFSASVTVTCERQFAGSNGDPTFVQLMGPDDGSVEIPETAATPWREYCEAFA